MNERRTAGAADHALRSCIAVMNERRIRTPRDRVRRSFTLTTFGNAYVDAAMSVGPAARVAEILRTFGRGDDDRVARERSGRSPDAFEDWLTDRLARQAGRA